MTEQARPSAAADYDSPWKEVVIHFFESFMSFFFHDIHAAIDWQRPVEFLDKELQQLAVEAEVGRRLADTLVKVWLRTGVEVWVLVHIEVQGQRDPDFERRIFVYYYRIFDRYNRQVISLAVLADTVRSWRPAEYRSELFQSGVRLRFRTVKLLDYSSRLAELQAATTRLRWLCWRIFKPRPRAAKWMSATPPNFNSCVCCMSAAIRRKRFAAYFVLLIG